MSIELQNKVFIFCFIANKGDSKELIQERDKAKAKCDLLTDKCKKLLAKCKQQEDTIKKHSEDLDMKKELEGKCSTLENEVTDKIAIIEKLQNGIKEITSESSEFKEKEHEIQIAFEKLQTELNETLKNSQNEIDKIREENEFKINSLEKELSEQTEAKDVAINDCKAKEQELEGAIQKLEIDLEKATKANSDFIDEKVEELKSQLQVRIF